ncbi:M1 family aminopeptidase [Paracidobacterium acidisoli]|uniref:Peptidase M1 n=1 Tax=Paracidobacterium acidisoli TaxID=2303751 RepID=A0A372IRT0_9BACT|nr:M1 family aminopeptidase [Paracidobacterium acidisoli]MBT9330484.1 peptidase M1 [Paracidobacterium acidisoli]
MTQSRIARTAVTLALLAVTIFTARSAAAADRPVINITAYNIDAELTPSTHTLTATARVTFTALDDLPVVPFEMHGALRVDKVTDDKNTPLNGERGAAAALLITPATPLVKGQSYTWTFHYSGALETDAGGAVEGLKLAYVGDPISYLFYAGRWFPMTGYTTDRFTAEIHVTVPAGYRVIGSGSTGAPHPPGTAPRPSAAPAARSGRPVLRTAAGAEAGTPTAAGGEEEYDFRWDKPGFPGTIIAGKFDAPVSVSGASNIKVYVTDAHKAAAADFAGTALKEFAFFTSTFGIPESIHLNVVELPDDTVPSYWAPEIAAIGGAHIGGKTDFRLLANTIAHQWWGSETSPATLSDTWITNGMARYGELMYLEDAAGSSALQQAVLDVSAGALAYDTIPLSSAGTLAPWSPQFQSMTLEKGAMVYHMLRWEVGDDSFIKILRAVLSQHTDKGIKTSEFQQIAEAQSQQQLTPFFSEWLDGTGAPQFNDKYAVYRLGNNKGFRTIGEIQQDLDLFRMPVDLRIETEGKTENKRVEVVGTDSQYVVDTFGRPRHIEIDPESWILKNTPEMQVKVAILKGQQLAAQGDTTGALAQYQDALKANPQSSLASYRIGELLFNMRNYQASVNAYRDALNGDDDPKWTEVWSHIQIGKIFDVTGQRDRAVNEYRQAVQTNDNTAGAMNEARHYLQVAYRRPAED